MPGLIGTGEAFNTTAQGALTTAAQNREKFNQLNAKYHSAMINQDISTGAKLGSMAPKILASLQQAGPGEMYGDSTTDGMATDAAANSPGLTSAGMAADPGSLAGEAVSNTIGTGLDTTGASLGLDAATAAGSGIGADAAAGAATDAAATDAAAGAATDAAATDAAAGAGSSIGSVLSAIAALF